MNKIELNRKKPDNILIGRPEYAFDGEEPVLATAENSPEYGLPQQLALQFGQLQNVIYARMVEKVGDRRYWEQWAKDVAAIAARQIERINFLIESRLEQRAAFASFLDGLQRSINPGIGAEQAVEMLAQQRGFSGHADHAGHAQFPKMAEQLGIVYTPVEAVDFIIRSVDDVLRKEFGRGVSNENVHILDPFAGTGTFIVQLLQSGLIRKEDFLRKYKEEIHANEIVLLAYYIAAVNIESVWHDLSGETAYTPFDSICLTDTFQMFEDGGQQALKGFFQENSERIDRQKKAPLRVIIGNPPYSAGQKSANDNAQNRKYERLDRRIAETYSKESSANLSKSL